nr:UxaA family hydrolase [Candidatus Njordarchaeum guaymaensis]
MSFMGYKRPDRSVGVRNHVAVMSTVMCANEVVLRIVDQAKGTVPLIHNQGCGEYAFMPYNTLAGLGKNPNVAALLVVGLGCEFINPRSLAKDIARSGKPVECIVIQEVGGSRKAIEQGVKIVQKMAEQTKELRREPAELSNLMLALECGGSDTTSGIAANPALGKAADMVVKAGGTVILAETLELIGTQRVLARRAVDEKAARQIMKVIGKMEERMTEAFPVPVPLLTPGNVQGGLTTVEEKSLGDSYKAGTSPIQGVLEYAQTPKKKGLWIMDEVGYDPESVTGMVAAGAQVVAFTTGLGTPSTFPIAPVTMITGNPTTYGKLKDDIDINAGTIIEGKEAIDDVGKRIYDEILAVASGKATKTDALGHRGSFAIYWPWPIPKEKLSK